MKTTDIAKIRHFLKQAKEGVEDLTPAGMCYPLYEEKQVVKNLDKALALLPCEICGGTGRVPSLYGLAQMHNTPREMVGSTKPCPDCQPKVCKNCNGTKRKIIFQPGQREFGGDASTSYETPCPDCRS